MARDGADPRVLEAHFEYVEYDLELADAGARTGNPLAAFHLQQAAEKLVTAVRLHRGLLPNKTHRIEELIDGNPRGGEPAALPPADPWREKLRSLIPLSDYATTYRYPTPSGKVRRGPKPDEVRAHSKHIRQLLSEARAQIHLPPQNWK